MTRKKRAGIGAQANCLARFLHPSKQVRDLIPHTWQKERFNDLIITGTAHRVVRKRSPPTTAYLLRSDRLPGVELYAAARNVVISREGLAEDIFDQTDVTTDSTNSTENPNPIQVDPAIRIDGHNDDPDFPFLAQGNLTAQDMASMLEQGIAVDNDNLPVEENALNNNPEEDSLLDWNFDAICKRRAQGLRNNKASFKNIENSVIERMTNLSLFQLLFPMDYVRDVIIVETNKKLKLGPLTVREFFVWLGLWLYMSCYQGIDRRSWWSQSEPCMEEGAPFRFSLFMTKNRFEDILSNLTYTNQPEPRFYDPFFNIRQMEDSWNANMEMQFDPSWANCLDESMMEWLNMYTCPGFMCVGRKPHPFGNERHTICCALSTILYRAEIVEGKDHPSELGPKKYQDLGGPTVGLMLRMTKPIHGSGKVVIMDSGFCVAKGITEMEKKGVFGQALIKKRRYWPRFVPGDQIDAAFSNKEVGETGSVTLKVDTGETFKVFCFKEPDYVMKIMSTFGTLEEKEDHQTRRTYKKNGEQISTVFNYIEPVSNHFRFRHQIDDHNNRRHSPVSIESTWATKYWPDRNFAWFIAVTEVNVNNVRGYFGGVSLPQLEFRRKLAWEMINNTVGVEKKNSEPVGMTLCPRTEEHELIKLKKFQGAWDATRKKFKKVKSQYQQQRCRNFHQCRKQTRTYCKCTKGMFLCVQCFAEHITSCS